MNCFRFRKVKNIGFCAKIAATSRGRPALTEKQIFKISSRSLCKQAFAKKLVSTRYATLVGLKLNAKTNSISAKLRTAFEEFKLGLNALKAGVSFVYA